MSNTKAVTPAPLGAGDGFGNTQNTLINIPYYHSPILFMCSTRAAPSSSNIGISGGILIPKCISLKWLLRLAI